MMPTPPTSSPQVLTPQRVALISRALFVSLGATLGPLMVQYLSSPAPLRLAHWVPVMLLSAPLGFVVARAVTLDAPSAAAGVARVVRRTLGFGVLFGVVSALLWSSLLPGGAVAMFPASVAFGVFYGLLGGLAFSVPFALWALLARRDLATASMLNHEKLTLRAGLFLSLGAVVGTFGYHHEVLQTLAQVAGIAGFAVTVLGLVGVFRVSRFFEGIETASIPNLRVVDRGEDLSAPAVVALPNLDRLAVLVPESLQSAPFRVSASDHKLAAVPSDLSAVRRGINRAVAVGAVLLLTVTALDALSLAGPYLQQLACPRTADCCNH